MAYSKALCLAAVLFAVVAAVECLPGPQPQGPVPVAPARLQPAEKTDKTDLKGESSVGFGYAYGGPWGGYGYPYYGGGYGGYGYGGYGYGYGYPYGYAYGYPYGGWGYYG